ncbi:MAG: glycosyltransferase [Elainellaceae cyanobacterium]
MTKRIALISEHASPIGLFGSVDSGGQNVYVGQVAKHLAVLGYEVDVFTRRDRADLPEVVQWQPGVRVILVPAGPDQFVPKEEMLPLMEPFEAFVSDWMTHHSYSLIHANFWMSALVAVNLKARFALPVVVTFHALGRIRRQHQGTADRFPDDRFEIEARVVCEADAIIAECPQDRDDLIALYSAPPQRIRVIPCGFDRGEFWPIDQQEARAALGLPEDERIVLQLGRIVPRKGVDNVVRGVAHLLQAHGLPARLLVVGGAADAAPGEPCEIVRLQRIAASHGVADRVQFMGQHGREILRQFYSAADVFVTTPWYEPFGITPLEAMACATPVIGSAVGGIKYTVKHGETGYLVAPNNPAELGDRLAFLYQNPELRTLLGRQALRHVSTQFTWHGVTQAIADLYETLTAHQSVRQTSLSTTTLLDDSFDSAIQAFQAARLQLGPDIAAIAARLSRCFAQGKKVLVCGNGGSAAEAQHFSAELMGRFRSPYRGGLPVIALTCDTALLTAWSNDVGYDDIFARQVSALAQPGDVLFAMSTSGRSRNLVKAFELARDRNIDRVALLGAGGGDLLHLSDVAIRVPSADSQRVQEVHLFVLHLLCELVEGELSRPQAVAGDRQVGQLPCNGTVPHKGVWSVTPTRIHTSPATQ